MWCPQPVRPGNNAEARQLGLGPGGTAELVTERWGSRSSVTGFPVLVPSFTAAAATSPVFNLQQDNTRLLWETGKPQRVNITPHLITPVRVWALLQFWVMRDTGKFS